MWLLRCLLEGNSLGSQMQLYGYPQGLDARSGLHGGYGEYMEILLTRTSYA